MTTASEILKLIETVDPSDTAKLDEIDLKVHMYIEPVKPKQCGASAQGFFGPPLYTRSRDALKAIRPDGWHFNFETGFSAMRAIYIYQCWKNSIDFPNAPIITAPALHQEELAELHAIVQAIQYERVQEKSE